jgi:flagellin
MSGMVINTNVPSLTAQRYLASSRADMEQAMERLSSGKRINSAMDDAAGLTISHSLDSKIASLGQAVRNANDGIALVNLAEGAMDEISSMLTRMKELATQAINGTYNDTDRDSLDLEYQALVNEITRISDNTKFNTVALIGSTDTIKFQLGDTTADSISVTFEDMNAEALLLDSSASVTTTNAHDADPAVAGSDLQDAGNAGETLVKIDNAIKTVDTYRAKLGAVANRMEHAAANLMSRVEHQSAARSQIQDADYAVESANLAKNQVLQQAGSAMLAQANASAANILSLLK